MGSELNKHYDINADDAQFISDIKAIVYTESIATNSHPRFNATVTYAFGYGKKVQQDNEVGEQSGASSAIMK